MDEIEEIPLETAEGARPSSTLGDRMIVGLALLVLLGGVLIAATNFLGGPAPDEAAAASSEPSAAVTPRPSRTPRPSPTPRPLRDVTVVPGTPTAPPFGGESQQMGWLKILSPTAELAAPSLTANEVRQRAAGEILLVYLDPPGWASVMDTQTGAQSFIHLEDATGDSVAEFYPADNQIYPGHVEGIWAGPDGMLATVWPPQRPYDEASAVLVRSADGEHWTRVEADPALTAMSPRIAWGPEGWLAISVSPWEGTPWIWQSYDGETWDALGELTGVDSGWPSGFAASTLGYVLLFDENRYNGPVTTTWFSRDGIYWQESPDPFGRSEGARSEGASTSVLATDAGFVAWTVNYGAGTERGVAFSRDGLHWSQVPIEGGRIGGDVQVAVAGKTLVALGRTPDGAVRAWSTDPADGASMQLRRDPGLELAFEDTVGVSLTGDGTIAYALGFGQSSAGPVVWRSDGGTFRRLRLPDPIPFGASISLGAVGPRGLVLIGSQGSVAGETPVFWHLRDDGTWQRETDPIIPSIPEPTAEECGPPPSTALEFAVLSPAWGPACFGDEPMTFTAWAAPCEWCPGEPPPSSADTWLLDASPGLLLRPVVGGDWPFSEAVLYPGLDELAADASGEWVRVTGHYDDPAAADCAFPFDPGNYYNTAGSAVTYCRQRFVVTELTVVDGP